MKTIKNRRTFSESHPNMKEIPEVIMRFYTHATNKLGWCEIKMIGDKSKAAIQKILGCDFYLN